MNREEKAKKLAEINEVIGNIETSALLDNVLIVDLSPIADIIGADKDVITRLECNNTSPKPIDYIVTLILKRLLELS